MKDWIYKGLIWFGCVVVYSLTTTLVSQFISLGALPTVGLALILVFIPAKGFCRLYDKHRGTQPDSDDKYIPPTYTSDLGEPAASFEAAVDSLSAPAQSSKDKEAIMGKTAANRILTVALALDRKTHPGEDSSVSRILTVSGALSAWAEKHLGQDRTVTNSAGSSLTTALYPNDATSQAIARGIFYRAAETMGITLTAFDGTNLKSAFIPRLKTMLELTSGDCDFIISSSLDALDAMYDGKAPSLDFPGLRARDVPPSAEVPAESPQSVEPSEPVAEPLGKSVEPEPLPEQRTPTERWYTCPYCGQLVREGRECDCRKLLKAAAQIRPDVYDRETSPAHADEQDAAARKPKKQRNPKRFFIWISCLGAICLVLAVTVGILAYNLYDRNTYVDHLAQEIENLETDLDQAKSSVVYSNYLNYTNGFDDAALLYQIIEDSYDVDIIADAKHAKSSSYNPSERNARLKIAIDIEVKYKTALGFVNYVNSQK